MVARHHRPRPAALRTAVRAFPQPRARLDAGFRHRFLPGPARRGDPVCGARVWRRPRRPDHHLRQASGQGGGARRRPRARHALRPGGPHRLAHPVQPGQPRLAEGRDRWRAAPAGDARQRRGGGAAARHGAAGGGAVPQRLHPRRRRGDRAAAARRNHLRLSRPAQPDAHHTVLDEARGAGEPRQVRLPRSQDAHRPAARGGAAGKPGRRDRARPSAARRQEELRDAGARRRGRRVPVRGPGHARVPARHAPGPPRGPDRRRVALPARPDGEHPGLLRAQARREVGAAARKRPPHPGGDLRHHGLPGTGDADRAGDGRLLAGRRRPAAPGDGQKEQGRDGEAARPVRRGRGQERDRGGEGRRDLRHDGEIRRLRLQQEPRGGLRARRLPDGVPQGEPPGRVPCRVHVARSRQDRQARVAHAGGVAARHQGPAARHQCLGRRVRRRGAWR